MYSPAELTYRTHLPISPRGLAHRTHAITQLNIATSTERITILRFSLYSTNHRKLYDCLLAWVAVELQPLLLNEKLPRVLISCHFVCLLSSERCRLASPLLLAHALARLLRWERLVEPAGAWPVPPVPNEYSRSVQQVSMGGGQYGRSVWKVSTLREYGT